MIVRRTITLDIETSLPGAPLDAAIAAAGEAAARTLLSLRDVVSAAVTLEQPRQEPNGIGPSGAAAEPAPE